VKLYLMRHCLTDDGPQMDAARDLNDTGREQAKVIRKFLKRANVKPDVILSSDFARSLSTAETIAKGAVVTDAALRPDGTVGGAWKAITRAAGDSKSILVVTHSPLIQPLLASVAFNFLDEKWNWEHGAVAYVNTADSRFRWFVTPKLAAHLAGVDPDDVSESDAFARGCLQLSEHLMRAHRASVINPLVAKLQTASAARFRRQKKRIVAALKPHARKFPASSNAEVRNDVVNAIPFSDAKFAKAYMAVARKARTAGQEHVAEQLGTFWEAEKKRKLPPLPIWDRTADGLQAELDATTRSQTETLLEKASDPAAPLDIAALLAGLQEQFDQYATGLDGKLSRAEMIAWSETSAAYHDGGAQAAEDAASAGTAIEKSWDEQPDACIVCLENASMGWIDADAPFSTGDFEPPAHPNCRCSVNYRQAED